MGTPAFSVPSLAGLISSGHDIAAVYSQPPRRAGRGHKLRLSAVHEFAEAHGLEVRTPVSLKKEREQSAFADLDADIAVVVAYGLLLPQPILEAPTHGCINLHGSLLPRWRGAAPIQRAIMAGDRITGVQIMRMDVGLDTGPILLSETVPVAPNDTATTLSHRLSQTGADLLPRALGGLERGTIEAVPQPAEGVTYATKISRDEAQIDWRRPASDVDGHIRGLSTVPGAWTIATGKDGEKVRLKILFSRQSDGSNSNAEPGEIVAADADGMHVAAGDGRILILSRLQRPGKAAQDAEPFLRGSSLSVGDQLR